MRGKVTFRHPQLSRHFVVEVAPLSAATLGKLAAALGRPLTVNEQADAARAVEKAKFSWITSAADRKVTLAALADAPEDDPVILTWLADCDPTTKAHVSEAAAFHGRGAEDLEQPAGIKAAARAALEHFRDTRGRRNTPFLLLAIRALELWRAWGGKDYSGSVNPGTGYATPLVRFTVELFEAANEPKSASAVARLLKEAERGANIG